MWSNSLCYFQLSWQVFVPKDLFQPVYFSHQMIARTYIHTHICTHVALWISGTEECMTQEYSYALVFVLKAVFVEIPWQARLAVAVFSEKKLNKQIEYSAGYQAKWPQGALLTGLWSTEKVPFSLNVGDTFVKWWP